MLKMGLLGPGRWAQRLVGSVQDKSDKVRFTIAGGRHPEAHAEFGATFGIEVSTHDAVFADPGIDAILIATPHSMHLSHALAAARAGKHVFMEKPLALTRNDAADIVAAFKQAGLVIGHGLNRRFAPAYLEMLKRLHEGQIGELLHLEGQFSGPSGYMLKPGMWRSERQECPAGAMTVRGIHVLDSMISMAGPVTSVYAHSDHRVLPVDIDDVTSALLRFGSGATGYLASHHATAEIWRVQIYGSKGWMEMRGADRLTVTLIDQESEQIPLTSIDIERAELEAFADAVSGTASYPVTNAQALNSIAAIEAMVASSESGQPQRIG